MRANTLRTSLLTLLFPAIAGGQCEITEIQQIVGYQGEAGDHFGRSVSIAGTLAVVGQPEAEYGSGGGQFFRYDGDSWSQVFRWRGAWDRSHLGASVAASVSKSDAEGMALMGHPDYEGWVVGFYDDGRGWGGPRFRLTPSDATRQGFGSSVSTENEWILVGAPGDDDRGSSAGAAYLFGSSGLDWHEKRKLTASDGSSDDQFGHAVSLRGDVAIVGAPFKEGGGAAYVYRFDGTTWREERKLTASNAQSGDQFGRSVAIYQHSQYDIVVVGAMREDSLGHKAGAAYVFRHDGRRWNEEQKLTASDGSPYDYFGYSVAASAGVVVVGAYAKERGGKVYAFRHDGTRWVETHGMKAVEWADGDHLGESVAASYPFILAGAPGEDALGAEAGSAYFFPLLKDLRLSVYPTYLRPGRTVKISTSFGYPRDLVGLAIVEANGVPMFHLVAVGRFQSPSFKWRLSSSAPGGLSGLELYLQSFGFTMCGKPGESNRVKIRFR